MYCAVQGIIFLLFVFEVILYYFVACAKLVKLFYLHIDLQDQITGLKFLVFSDNFFGSMHSFLARHKSFMCIIIFLPRGIPYLIDLYTLKEM